jgi:hypothetical protein
LLAGAWAPAGAWAKDGELSAGTIIAVKATKASTLLAVLLLNFMTPAPSYAISG